MILQRRHAYAALLGAGLLLLMLVLAALSGGTRQAAPEETLVRREVQMYEPPPPPPPPTQAQEGGGGGQPLAIVSGRSEVQLEVMELDVSVPVAALGMGGIGAGGFGAGGIDEGMNIDLGTVALGDLDGYPVVVSSPLLNFEGLRRRRIPVPDEFTVMFHIMIDEEGRTWPVRIVENEYPAANAELLDYAADVRFTPPKRLGVPVKTEYLWPVVFSEKGR